MKKEEEGNLHKTTARESEKNEKLLVNIRSVGEKNESLQATINVR